MKEKQSLLVRDGVSFLIPFILITSCFALWGFANDITNPMVKAFSKIFRMNVTDGALVQVAFYGGYFAMAFPAAIFIRKFSYKAGILLGLDCMPSARFFFSREDDGELLSVPDRVFLLNCDSLLRPRESLYSFLGTEETATRRLNLAQRLIAMGSLLGMYVAIIYQGHESLCSAEGGSPDRTRP